MKQFAIIGVGRFSRRMLEELADAGSEILLIDKDREVVEAYKDKAAATYIANVLSEEVITKLVPVTVDAAIVDLGDNLEASILVTNYLHKAGVKRIITKAESEQHAEILDLVGATDIIFPNKEAARRIAPLLLSHLLFSYLPLSRDFAIAEIKVPGKLVGKSLIEANIRQQHHMNVIALRKEGVPDYTYFLPDYRLQDDDLLLVAGKDDDISEFAQMELPAAREGMPNVFSRMFSRFREKKPDSPGDRGS
jgi:trk system potassium uptake protein